MIIEQDKREDSKKVIIQERIAELEKSGLTPEHIRAIKNVEPSLEVKILLLSKEEVEKYYGKDKEPCSLFADMKKDNQTWVIKCEDHVKVLPANFNIEDLKSYFKDTIYSIRVKELKASRYPDSIINQLSVLSEDLDPDSIMTIEASRLSGYSPSVVNSIVSNIINEEIGRSTKALLIYSGNQVTVLEADCDRQKLLKTMQAANYSNAYSDHREEGLPHEDIEKILNPDGTLKIEFNLVPLGNFFVDCMEENGNRLLIERRQESPSKAIMIWTNIRSRMLFPDESIDKGKEIIRELSLDKRRKHLIETKECSDAELNILEAAVPSLNVYIETVGDPDITHRYKNKYDIQEIVPRLEKNLKLKNFKSNFGNAEAVAIRIFSGELVVFKVNEKAASIQSKLEDAKKIAQQKWQSSLRENDQITYQKLPAFLRESVFDDIKDFSHALALDRAIFAERIVDKFKTPEAIEGWAKSNEPEREIPGVLTNHYGERDFNKLVNLAIRYCERQAAV